MSSTNNSPTPAQAVVDACGSPMAPVAEAACQQSPLTPIADTLPSPPIDKGRGVSNQQRTLVADTPAALALKYKVSLRTAKRMRKPDYCQSEPSVSYWGTTIPGRTVGKDGKSYPHQRNRYNRTPRHPYSSSVILKALRHARYGVRRADRIACEDGVTSRDMAALASLFDEVFEVIGRWAEVSTDAQNGGRPCGSFASQKPRQGLCLPLQQRQRPNPYQGGGPTQPFALTVDKAASEAGVSGRSTVA